MPYAPLVRCAEPGCSERVQSGRCDMHRRERYRVQDTQRPHASARGYGAQWRKYRAMYLKACPTCSTCEEHGQAFIPAEHVDHIIPIDGADDVLFWFPANHQALCHACHTHKTFHIDQSIKARRLAGEFATFEHAARLWAEGRSGE